VIIRPFTPADFEPVVALFVAAYPERADEPDQWDDTVIRFVAVADEVVVGYAGCWRVRHRQYRMDLAVAAHYRRRGVGGRLLSLLADQAWAAGAGTLQARTESDRLDVLAFLDKRGFAETMRMHRLVLDVSTATLSPYLDLEAALAAQGIGVTTLADEQDRIGEACWDLLCDLHNDAIDGWPNPDPSPVDPLTPPEFRERYERIAHLWPEPCFLGVRGEEYVGYAGPTGTAVRPTMRGRGIATALKVRVITAARERGVATLHSSTGNAAMLKVNERLGYRRTSTEVRLVLQIAGCRSPAA
jgi:mycothiol synthase